MEYCFIWLYIRDTEQQILKRRLMELKHKRLQPTIKNLCENSENHQLFHLKKKKRFAGHCWRSKQEVAGDVLLWRPIHGRQTPGRPKSAYLLTYRLMEDSGCRFKDLPNAMNNRGIWKKCLARLMMSDKISSQSLWRKWAWSDFGGAPPIIVSSEIFFLMKCRSLHW